MNFHPFQNVVWHKELSYLPAFTCNTRAIYTNGKKMRVYAFVSVHRYLLRIGQSVHKATLTGIREEPTLYTSGQVLERWLLTIGPRQPLMTHHIPNVRVRVNNGDVFNGRLLGK